MDLLNKIKYWIETQRLITKIYYNQATTKAEYRRWLLEEELLWQNSLGVTDERIIAEGQLIVSLTSFGRRLFDVPYTIQSIMRQTVKPNRIVLWIDQQDKNNIPVQLKNLQNRGLEIKLYSPDIRSYKKLIPALKEFPEDVIVTVDDDVFYECDLIERLVKAHRENPQDIIAARCHKIKLDEAGTPLPYNSWAWNVQDETASSLNFLTGVGGVLYPPHSLHSDVMNEKVFKSLAPTADDVWFHFMAVKNGTKIRKVATRFTHRDDFYENPALIFSGLRNINTVGEKANDRQIKAVKEYYNISLK